MLEFPVEIHQVALIIKHYYKLTVVNQAKIRR